MLELMPCAGIANRMRAIASAAAAAELLGRPLRIGWKVDPGIQTAAFSDLFDPASLAPTISVVELGRAPGDWNRAPETNSEAAWASFLAANSGPVLTFKSWAAFFGAGTEPWLRHLRSLRPAAPVKDEVDTIFAGIPPDTPLVGVHIRRTDHVRSTKDSPTRLFWQAIKEAVAADPNTLFYVASDDEQERAAVRARFPGRVITGPETLLGRSTVEGCQGGLVDLLCLSRCDRILGSAGSSFGEIAAAYGGCPLVVLRE